MTKKDYQLLAAALREAREGADARRSVDVRYGIALAENRIRRVLAQDNPRFDDVKFMEAAGTFDASLQGGK